MPKKDKNSDPLIASNRKAFHDFTVVDRYEAGIKLTGTEVKSCRARTVNMADSYVDFLGKGAEAELLNMHISPYENGGYFNHPPVRRRKLLLHKNEILKLFQQTREKGLTVIPLKMYFVQGLVKVELGLCRGKNQQDKRETLREKQVKMEVKRLVKDYR